MINLTPVASERLAKLMQEKDLTDYGLRVFVSGGGCAGVQYGMAFEERPRDEDQVFERNGLRIIVDPTSLPYLAGATIDYADSLMGGGFSIENPNATCGCGQSFGAEGSTPADYSGACPAS
jgi:iron-sulfur cluster assembly protein